MPDAFRNYDAWLEKPYQEQYAREDAEAEREFDDYEAYAEHEAWEAEMRTQQLEAQWEREQIEAEERMDAEVEAYRR